MRRFCIRHLSVIFSLCLIATSSYVLFDLLDIDGSDFKEYAQGCAFEAVMPASSGETKFTATDNPPPWPLVSRAPLFTTARMGALAPRPAPHSISRCFIVHIHKALQRESTSLARGSDPAKRSA